MTGELYALCNKVRAAVWFTYERSSDRLSGLLKKHPDFDKKSYGRRIKALNRLFDDLCDLMKLKRRFIQLEIVSYVMGDVGAVGGFIQNSHLGCRIIIHYKSSFALSDYVAIMLHELGHFFIMTHGICFGEDEEICNDLLLVFMGFGEALKVGYSPKDTGERPLSFGYITPLLIEESMDYFDSLIQ